MSHQHSSKSQAPKRTFETAYHVSQQRESKNKYNRVVITMEERISAACAHFTGKGFPYFQPSTWAELFGQRQGYKTIAHNLTNAFDRIHSAIHDELFCVGTDMIDRRFELQAFYYFASACTRGKNPHEILTTHKVKTRHAQTRTKFDSISLRGKNLLLRRPYFMCAEQGKVERTEFGSNSASAGLNTLNEPPEDVTDTNHIRLQNVSANRDLPALQTDGLASAPVSTSMNYVIQISRVLCSYNLLMLYYPMLFGSGHSQGWISQEVAENLFSTGRDWNHMWMHFQYPFTIAKFMLWSSLRAQSVIEHNNSLCRVDYGAPKARSYSKARITESTMLVCRGLSYLEVAKVLIKINRCLAPAEHITILLQNQDNIYMVGGSAPAIAIFRILVESEIRQTPDMFKFGSLNTTPVIVTLPFHCAQRLVAARFALLSDLDQRWNYPSTICENVRVLTLSGAPSSELAILRIVDTILLYPEIHPAGNIYNGSVVNTSRWCSHEEIERYFTRAEPCSAFLFGMH